VLFSIVFVLAHARDNCSDPHQSRPSFDARPLYPTQGRIERTLVLSFAERERRERSSSNAAHHPGMDRAHP
jgi:hypothetical protein